MGASTLLNGFISHYCLSYCLFAVYVLFKVHLWTRVMQFQQQSSLSKVPGPRLAKWTRLWIAKALSTGRSHEVWTEMNAKYGLLARIGPRHVVTDDPAITRHILAARSGYERGPAFDSLRIDPMVPNIVSQRDEKKHSVIRAMVAPSVKFTFHLPDPPAPFPPGAFRPSLFLFMLTRAPQSSPAAPSMLSSPLWTRKSACGSSLSETRPLK